MADTTRSLAALQTLLADNTSGDISAQDARDFLVSTYKPQAWPAGGRLTLTTAVPVTTGDVSAASTIYYTPFVHNCVGLYDGTSWTLFTFTERSLALSGLTSGKNYDVFLYDNAGTLTLELSAAWTNDTTRADALTTQDGVYVKSGATTRRLVGTIRTTGTTTTEDSATKRFVWNAANRVHRWLKATDTTDSWTYTTATWRQARASSANQVEYVCGLAEDAVAARVASFAHNSSIAFVGVAVGVDSTSSPSGVYSGAYSANIHQKVTANYTGVPGVGYHYLAWLESSDAVGTTTWYGDAGVTSIILNGLTAEVTG